jgi:hypothetical protein
MDQDCEQIIQDCEIMNKENFNNIILTKLNDKNLIDSILFSITKINEDGYITIGDIPEIILLISLQLFCC